MINKINNLIEDIDTLELEQKANIINRQKIEDELKLKEDEFNRDKESLELVMKALALLRQVSDEAVQNSYTFITSNINQALERIFSQSKRKIRLKESTRGGMYPQLEIELIVENGKVRSLKEDSGHGIMQIVSLLCILSLIAITGNRRILVLDETLSGLSSKSRQVLDDVLWAFTDIGFQFIISEHGYIPKGSQVYKLETINGTSRVVKEYIQENGVYLDTLSNKLEPISETNKETSLGGSILDI